MREQINIDHDPITREGDAQMCLANIHPDILAAHPRPDRHQHANLGETVLPIIPPPPAPRLCLPLAPSPFPHTCAVVCPLSLPPLSNSRQIYHAAHHPARPRTPAVAGRLQQDCTALPPAHHPVAHQPLPRQLHHTHRRTYASHRAASPANAELPAAIASKRPHAAIVHESEGMLLPARHTHHASFAHDITHTVLVTVPGVQCCDQGRDTYVSEMPQPQLPLAVVAAGIQPPR